MSESIGLLGEDALGAFDAERRRLDVPGAILYVRSPSIGRVVRAFGVADLATGAELATNTMLRIGSITKTMVATAILVLVDAGRIGLDDDARRYIDVDIALPDGVSIRRLLNMTSGLPDYTDEDFVSALVDAPGRLWTPRELLETAFRSDQRFAPGTSWEYCNSGYILLGLIVEEVTGTPLEHVMQTLLFDPLGLTDTMLTRPVRGVSPLPDPQVRGYSRSEGGFVDATAINPSWAWAAGGVIASASDVSVWIESLARGTLLDPRTHKQRLEMIPVAEGLRYGLGIADFAGMLGHNGGLPGFQSFGGHDPATATTLVVLTTVDDGAADSLAAFARARLLVSPTG